MASETRSRSARRLGDKAFDSSCHRGIGHHVNHSGVQNCGWNYPDASSTAMAWMNSPGHRENLLSPDITRFGIAMGPGPYWTLNAR
jgi:hypothetical protein